MRVMQELKKQTFAVQYNPNCPRPYLVRLIPKGFGKLDMRFYGAFGIHGSTNDVLGFGNTLRQAAEKALKKKLKQK